MNPLKGTRVVRKKKKGVDSNSLGKKKQGKSTGEKLG